LLFNIQQGAPWKCAAINQYFEATTFLAVVLVPLSMLQAAEDCTGVVALEEAAVDGIDIWMLGPAV
jgi:hypothetical protein